MPVEPVPLDGLSRGVVQRVQKRRRATQAQNSTVDALNWMAGAHSATSAEASTCTREVWDDVSFGHELYAKAPILAPKEAACALLKGRSGYEREDTILRPYVQDQVSLPDYTEGAPFVADVLEALERKLLRMLTILSLRGKDELEAHPEVVPFLDPILRHDRAKYIDFIKSLDSKGLIEWRSTHRCQVAVFFVATKDPH